MLHSASLRSQKPLFPHPSLVPSCTEFFLRVIKSPPRSIPAEAKVIRIFSNMQNETAAFNMPALIALGPEGMFEQARRNHLLIDLKGYRVVVLGASPLRLDPLRGAQ
jgi:hypothetical protein